MTEPRILRLGTRSSALAQAQAALAAAALARMHPDATIRTQIVRTLGDRVTETPLSVMAAQASGVFTSTLETALCEGEIDVAVHSAKDLPIEPSAGVALAAALPRADVRDVLISRNQFTLNALPRGAVVGTSSPRRAAQLWATRPDLAIDDLRGNVDTRIARALDADGPFDAIVLARAGLDRLNRSEHISETLSLNIILPAPAQGAIVLQTRADAEWVTLVEQVNDAETFQAITAERAFLQGLGGGCALPVAAYASMERSKMHLRGRVLHRQGRQQVDVEGRYPIRTDEDARAAGFALAQQALDSGARALMAEDDR